MTDISTVVDPGTTPPTPLSVPAEPTERARALTPGVVARQREIGSMMVPRRYTGPRVGGAKR
ncbi:hypothetical protein GA0070608_4265 [Micromonospora peucetia]|uniref:Uncharacterized protein n=1 Tax=Micromonospora peucetia TaxID=47871 RepID=A0A1C6VVI7_9ACTN|nr:hypothetical protein GA0070608_4265 [Micromonospora peucetia]